MKTKEQGAEEQVGEASTGRKMMKERWGNSHNNLKHNNNNNKHNKHNNNNNNNNNKNDSNNTNNGNNINFSKKSMISTTVDDTNKRTQTKPERGCEAETSSWHWQRREFS